MDTKPKQENVIPAKRSKLPANTATDASLVLDTGNGHNWQQRKSGSWSWSCVCDCVLCLHACAAESICREANPPFLLFLSPPLTRRAKTVALKSWAMQSLNHNQEQWQLLATRTTTGVGAVAIATATCNIVNCFSWAAAQFSFAPAAVNLQLSAFLSLSSSQVLAPSLVMPQRANMKCNCVNRLALHKITKHVYYIYTQIFLNIAGHLSVHLPPPPGLGTPLCHLHCQLTFL